ncbi:glycosyltransferase family 4 protein [Hoeflea prorocentri]|uniref:Glycosyltransferase family 4 protein n=1 Tax=Hoeflea prorocentri TaxID=1922333 RepID=A0A9X3ZHD9_9HYPH|nr:glycosyltransferase family 4 protein [Hoeflea prorocentri]MCY6380803.1 glycosyltransferase family 4 protein [Hoeflea prorocentri]MDA5398603.1 glycosyltransferase family 4 protein [Hoeflea prorocentri]
MGGTIVVVLKGYPRLSETFIAQEILELQRAGFSLHLFSLRHPTDKQRHPIHSEITAPVTYLPEYLHEEPMRVLRGWLASRKLPGYGAALRQFLKDLVRDRTRNRIRRFGQALVMANELPADTAWLYVHFIHTPGSVTRYTHLITGKGWSCSAHAKDIWTSPDWELSEKLDDATWTVTCTKGGHEHLQALCHDPRSVHLVHHGIDLKRFPPAKHAPSERDGGNADKPVRIVTVGRAVKKKGLDTLISALAMLPANLHWQWTHIGGGVLSDELKRQVADLGLSDQVHMLGSRSQEFILNTYRESDLFVLPSRIAPDGDRDGLPNVLVEAQSQALACISSPISGIVELIEDGENGLLVGPDDDKALAAAIEKLAKDPTERRRMGKNGAERVVSLFDHRTEIQQLIKLFGDLGLQPTLEDAAQ